MALLFTITLLALIVGGIAFGMWWGERRVKLLRSAGSYVSRDETSFPEVMAFTISVIAFIVFAIWLFVAPIQYIGSSGAVASLQAKLDTMDEYQQTINQTADVTIAGRNTLNDNTITDLAYRDAAATYSQRVAEYRDLVRSYNNQLRNLRNQNAMPIIGGVTKNVPKELQPR